MKVVGLNNKEYILDIKKYIIKNNDTKKKSRYHILARELLNDMFVYPVLEEVKLPGSRCPSKKSTLFLDFFIPQIDLAVEVHGKQHYEYCKFFHKTKAGFLTSLKRDSIKEEWCEKNEINLIILKYSDTVEDWRKQIDSR
jgi:hypothetical protein